MEQKVQRYPHAPVPLHSRPDHQHHQQTVRVLPWMDLHGRLMSPRVTVYVRVTLGCVFCGFGQMHDGTTVSVHW